KDAKEMALALEAAVTVAATSRIADWVASAARERIESLEARLASADMDDERRMITADVVPSGPSRAPAATHTQPLSMAPTSAPEVSRIAVRPGVSPSVGQ